MISLRPNSNYKKKLPEGTEKPQNATKAGSPMETMPEPEKVPQNANVGDLDTFVKTWIGKKSDDEICRYDSGSVFGISQKESAWSYLLFALVRGAIDE